MKPTNTIQKNVSDVLMPPQATDIEQAVLGSMLNDKNGLDEALMILRTPEIFYVQSHKLIFIAIAELYSVGQPVDILTVSDKLVQHENLEKVGGDYYLIQLVQKVSSSAHIEFHARILLQKFMKRKIISFSAGITKLAYAESTDVFELLQRWQKEFDGVADLTNKGRTTETFANALVTLRDNIEVISKNTEEVKLIGKPTGFLSSDKHTGGYRDQSLVIIAARPGMGKTAKVLKTIIANVKIGNAVGFFSLEMSMEELTARVVAIDTDFHLGQLLKNGFDKPEYYTTLSAHSQRMKDYNLIVDDSGNSDITELIITAKMWKRVHDVKMIVVDYIQLMKDSSVHGNRETEVASISRRLKMLAKELNVPVIALSQLSRAVETRGGSKRPLLSDLRESGAIEQDADIIEFIYRPEYYNITDYHNDYTDAKHQEAISRGANSEIIYAKYRAGSKGTLLLKWVGDKTKFVDVFDDGDTANHIDQNHLPLGNPNTVFDAE